MKIAYDKDKQASYQSLEIEINAGTENVFFYLGTTAGISQWFPQLSFSKERESHKLFFDLGDGTFEEMEVREYDEPETIGFTWDVGYVKLSLREDGENTVLTLEEKLPFEFETISQDFTGWQFQIQNIKHISETGKPKDLKNMDFEAQKAKVAAELNL